MQNYKPTALGQRGKGTKLASNEIKEMSKDKDYIKMIHSARWLRLRHEVLSMHPLCEKCKEKGYVQAAREVHHITPVETALTYTEKERLMFNPGNLIALCHDCHVKIHTEMGRSGREANKKRQSERVEKIKEKFF